MRKITLLSVLFAVLATVACSRTDEEMDLATGVGVTSICGKIDATGSRTHVENLADGSIQMLWSAGDEVLVTDLSASAKFKLKSGAKTTVGTFSGSILSKSQNMYAIYPASAATIDGGTTYVTIPRQQIYTATANVNVDDRNVMIGASSDASEFKFSTIASIARFKVKVPAEESILSITMRVEDGYLSGDGSVDLAARTLGQVDRRDVTLTYADPAKGESNGGWALIAPVDFTATSGKVYYDVTTDKGVYTFCRKPNKAFKAGCIYNFPLSVDTFEQVASSSELVDGKYTFSSNESTLTVRLVRATDTTISIAWSSNGFPADYSADVADLYELYLYDERNQLLVAWQPNDALCVTNNALFPYSATNPTFPPRFVFSGLTPNTVYKVKVKNLTTSKSSSTITLSTAPTDCSEIVGMAQQEGDVLVFQNFGKLVWNGDLTTQAAGYVAYDYKTVENIAEATAWGDFRSSSQTSYKYTRRDREQNLFTTYSKATLHESLGLSDWAYWRNSSDDAKSSTSSTVLARPGYVKISATDVRAGIATPELKQLLGKATVKVTFKAALYGTTGPDDHNDVAVMALDNCTLKSDWRINSSYTQLAKSQLKIDKSLAWNTYTVELSGVTPTSRIVICSDVAAFNGIQNRFHLDDIKVEFVKYDENVNSNVPEVKQIAAQPYNATIEWNEVEQESRKYTVSLYKDAACSDLHQSFTITYGTSGYVGNWPTRFTFQHLEASRNYYATVTDLAGNISRPVLVRTADVHKAVANEVLYEGFDVVCWGGDYMNMAASSKLNVNSVATYKPTTLGESLSSSTAVSAGSDGSQLTTYSAEVRSLFGLSDWSSAKAHSRPGYLKLGTSSAAGSITTPAITNLSSSNADMKVTFKACPYLDDATVDQTPYVYVEQINGTTGEVVESIKVTIGGSCNIPGWGEYEVNFKSVSSGDKISIRAGAESQSRFCVDDILLTSTAAIVGDFVSGYIKDTEGNPIADVAVSDGFSVVKTNSNGYYTLEPNKDTYYIYYSIPADCEVPTNSYGQPAFFTAYKASQKRYDFTLTKLSNGAEKQFTLFCLADPQCKDSTHRSYFKNETLPDIKKHVASKSTPSYGVTLGDVVYSEGNRNCVSQMTYMRDHMNKSNTGGMPIFQTMGNHDYTFFSSSVTISADETSSTYNVKAQREFERVFGPIDYSWNRGDVHFVCMRNMQWNANNNAANYTMQFTDAQYKWLKQDLSHVPTSKMVIICVHIPFASYPNNTNVQNVINLLKNYKEAHIMSGHTHYNRNEPTKAGGKVYEHVHAAVCGTWWYSKINGDGCPNGYGVYEIDGATIKNWYYKGANSGMNDVGYQMRLYPGNLRCGGKYDYIQLQHGSNVLLANVFNVDPNWTIEVYEDGVKKGTMTQIAVKGDSPAYSTNESSPCKPSTASSQDWWAIGLHTGIVGRGNSAVGGNRSSYLTTCYHMYKYTISNTSAKIKVVVKDRFGNEYASETITQDYDYTNAKR